MGWRSAADALEIAIRRFASQLDAMGFSVLICDDVPAVRTMMRRMLEREGLSVAGLASTAEEVLTLYESSAPDVVLLDLNMPGANGLGLLRSLRTLDQSACVVICSGACEPAVRDEAQKLGAADWVLKPIYSSSLVALLRDVVVKNGTRGAPLVR
jgi:two-component system, chemotaxis family, chemotaxis protein CheY